MNKNVSGKTAQSNLRQVDNNAQGVKRRARRSRKSMWREELKKEAIRRMRLLGVASDVVELFEQYDQIPVYQADTDQFGVPNAEQQAKIRNFEQNGVRVVYFVLQQSFAHRRYPDSGMQQTTSYLYFDKSLDRIQWERDHPEEYPPNSLCAYTFTQDHPDEHYPNGIVVMSCLLDVLTVQGTPSGGLKRVR